MSMVFISYSHVDSEVADSIVAVFEKLGIKYFRDVKHIKWGRSISGEVRGALERSVAILVILSPASIKSQWVPYEVGYGRALHKRVLPFLTHPSIEVPGYMGDLRRISSIAEMREYFENTPLPEAVKIPTTRIELVPAQTAAKIIRLMPELLAEMQCDVKSEGNELVREFVMLPNRNVAFSSTKRRFYYFENEHRDLKNKVDILQQFGLVRDVTPKRAPIYRMNEKFVDWLREIVLT